MQEAADAFRALLQVLPLHAEEGAHRERVSEALLARALDAGGAQTSGQSSLLLGGVRRLFEVLCLLDRFELEQGRWAFVSFPASLLGRSILESLAVPGQSLFASHYWEQGAHRPEALVEQQRLLLRELEQRRARYHPQGAARPIRTVHVAWALIRFGQQFLLVHREDRSRHEGRDYVFPGGRLNDADVVADAIPEIRLRDLLAIDSALAATALPRTLERELEEELGLLPDEYSAEQSQTLEPFLKVEGARNHQALTQYHIVLFTLRLTRSGELRILRREAEVPAALAWFSAAELERKRNALGQGAFIDALHASLGPALGMQLQMIADSRAEAIIPNVSGVAFDLPAHAGAPALVGKTGKEVPVLLDLDQDAWELLQILGRHALGLPVTPLDGALRVLGGGWVRLDCEDLRDVAQRLAATLVAAGYEWVEWVQRDLVRMRVAPEQVNLPSRHYAYELAETHVESAIAVTLEPLLTRWARLEKKALLLPLSPVVVAAIRSLESGIDPRTDRRLESADLEREFRRVLTHPLRTIGLRKFVYIEAKRLHLVPLAPG